MVPNGWESIRLNKISETVTSGSRDWAQYYSDSGSKFIRMTNLPRDGIYLKLGELKYVDIHSNSSDGKRTSLKAGDLLISITAELGKIGWVPPDFGEAYINQHTALVRIKENSADSKYIAYLLSSHAMNHKINRLNDSGAKAGLNLPTIRSIPMLLPPLPEQRKIAQILSTWDRGIATTKKLIDTSKQQKKSLMQQLLTGKKRLVDPETGKAFEGEWEEVKLYDVTDVRDGTHDSPEFVDKGYPLVTSKNLLASGKLDLNNVKHVSEDDYLQINKRSNVDVGDILFGMIGTIGNPVRVCSSDYAIKNVALLKEKESLLNSFLIHYLSSANIEKQFHKLNAGGTQKFIALGVIRNLIVQIPKIEEQQKIASVLTAADKEIELLEAKLAHLKQEKKALMQQLLTGKRRVQVEAA